MSDTTKFTHLDAERFIRLAKVHLLALSDIDLYHVVDSGDITINWPTRNTATVTFDYAVPDPNGTYRGACLHDNNNPGQVMTERRTIEVDPQNAYSYEVDLIRIKQLSETG